MFILIAPYLFDPLEEELDNVCIAFFPFQLKYFEYIVPTIPFGKNITAKI